MKIIEKIGYYVGGYLWNQQQNTALESMKEWLAHPDELGKEPAKIELAGEFRPA